MSRDSKEVRVRHAASIGRALLGRGNSQCKGPKVSIITSSTVFLDFPDSSVGKESACNAGDLGSIPGLGRSPGEGHGYLLQYSGLENSIDVYVCVCVCVWCPKSFIYYVSMMLPREGNGNPLQYSCLENPMDRGAWQATVHVVAKSRTWLSKFHLPFHCLLN